MSFQEPRLRAEILREGGVFCGCTIDGVDAHLRRRHDGRWWLCLQQGPDYFTVDLAESGATITRNDWANDAQKETPPPGPGLPPPAPAGERVHHPYHYNQVPGVECMEVIEALGMGYHVGNAFAYLWRERDKNGLEDLRKARAHLDHEIARREREGGGR